MGLQINLDQTNFICIGQQQSDLLREGSKLIKHCTQYKYLQMKINREGTNDKLIVFPKCHQELYFYIHFL
jgi:hypothetical protein